MTLPAATKAAIDACVKARIATRKEALAILELIAETKARIPDDEVRRHFMEIIDASVHAELFPKEAAYKTGPLLAPPPLDRICEGCRAPLGPCSRVNGQWLCSECQRKNKREFLPADIAEALEIIDEMEELAEEVPEPGQGFAEDVLEKAKSIGETISRSGSVTGLQRTALENMRDGLSRWVRD